MREHHSNPSKKIIHRKFPEYMLIKLAAVLFDRHPSTIRHKTNLGKFKSKHVQEYKCPYAYVRIPDLIKVYGQPKRKSFQKWIKDVGLRIEKLKKIRDNAKQSEKATSINQDVKYYQKMLDDSNLMDNVGGESSFPENLFDSDSINETNGEENLPDELVTKVEAERRYKIEQVKTKRRENEISDGLLIPVEVLTNDIADVFSSTWEVLVETVEKWALKFQFSQKILREMHQDIEKSLKEAAEKIDKKIEGGKQNG